MASVFLYSEGAIMIDLEKRTQTINGEYYYALELRQLKETMTSKRRGKLRTGEFLLQENAPTQTAPVEVAESLTCGFQLLPHSP